jgi:ATP-dependent Lon protease
MATSLASLLSNRKVRHDLAMTGEITLRGKVLPVGGVKEKVLAARRAGIRTVILPARNEKDLLDIPEEVRRTMTFIFAREIGDVLKQALRSDKGARHGERAGTRASQGRKESPGKQKSPAAAAAKAR